MANNDTFTFYRTWLKAAQMLPADSTARMIAFIVGYGLDGEEPDNMTDFEKGVWVCIKSEIDEAQQKAECKHNRRVEAGRKGGLAKASKSSNASNAKHKKTKYSITTGNSSELPSNPSNARNATNATPPYNPPIIYSSSSSSSSPGACEEDKLKEKLLRWITESMVEQIERVQFQLEKRLTDYGKTNYTRMTIQELATEFYDYDFRVREYCQRSERTDALAHFQNWFPKIIKKQIDKANENDNKRNQNTPAGPISSVSDTDYFANS